MSVKKNLGLAAAALVAVATATPVLADPPYWAKAYGHRHKERVRY